MSSPLLQSLKRRSALIGAVSALAIALGASTASAATLSPVGPYSSTKLTPVTVSGEAPVNTDLVAVSVCNAEFLLGTHCDIVSATKGLLSVEEFEEEEITINVRRGNAPGSPANPWQDWDFSSGTPTPVPGATTFCKKKTMEAPNQQCGVAVSFYEETGMGPKHLSDEAVPIGFL